MKHPRRFLYLICFLSMTLIASDTCCADERVTVLQLRDHVGHLAFSSDGRWLACSTGELGASIKIWDMSTGKLAKVLTDRKLKVGMLAFTPDGKELVSVDPTPQALVWNLTTYEMRLTFPLQASGYPSISPNGKTLIARGAGGVTAVVYDLSNGKQKGLLPAKPGLCSRMAFSANGKYMVSAHTRGPFVLWDLENKKQIEEFTLGDNLSGGPFAFSHDSKTLAVVCNSRWIIIRDIIREKEKTRFQLSKELNLLPFAVEFTRDGKYLLIAGGGSIRAALWNMEEGTIVNDFVMRSPENEKNTVQFVATSPDGKYIALAGKEDMSITVWKLPSPKPRN